MKQNRILLTVFMFLTMGLGISHAQDKEHCIILELSSGEKQEVYLSAHPRLTQNNNKVNLVTDVGTTELGTASVKKVYTSLATLKLVYKVDGEVYKSFLHCEGVSLTPVALPEKEGYTFSGWSEVPSTMPAKDVTVTGTFSINSYTITYMIDGEVYKTETIEYGSTITPPTVDEKTGFEFLWEDYPQTMPAKDITINGKYTQNTGISNINGSNGIMVKGGDVFLSGLQPNEAVKVYSVAGELLLSTQATPQGDLTIPHAILVSGVNIIKTNSQTYKITKQ